MVQHILLNAKDITLTCTCWEAEYISLCIGVFTADLSRTWAFLSVDLCSSCNWLKRGQTWSVFERWGLKDSTITTHLSSLLITSICCCNNDASVCASPPTPLSSDVSLPASLSMSDNRFVSNAMATFFSTLSCSSFCHSCSLSVNTRLGESSIPARPFVSRLTGSL